MKKQETAKTIKKTKAIKLTQTELDKKIAEHLKWFGTRLDLSEFTTPDGTTCYYECDGLTFPKDVSYAGVKFKGSVFRNCIFTDCDLTGCNFNNCDLSFSDFSGAFMEKSTIKNAILAYVNFTLAILKNTNCSGSNFTNAICKETKLSHSILNGCIFKKTDLTVADLRHTSCSDSDFTDAICVGTDFFKSFLQTCLFQRTEVSKASFERAKISSSRFDHVICHETLFERTDCTHTLWLNTDFGNAYLYATNLSYNLLVNCTGFDTAEIKCKYSESSASQERIYPKFRDAVFLNTKINPEKLEQLMSDWPHEIQIPYLLIDRATLLSLGMQPKENSLFFSVAFKNASTSQQKNTWPWHLKNGDTLEITPLSKDRLLQFADTQAFKEAIEQYSRSYTSFRLDGDLQLLTFPQTGKLLTLENSITSYPFTLHNEWLKRTLSFNCTLMSDVGYSNIIIYPPEINLTLEEAWKKSKEYNGIVLKRNRTETIITAYWHAESAPRLTIIDLATSPSASATYLKDDLLFSTFRKNQPKVIDNKRFIHEIAVLFGCTPQEKKTPTRTTTNKDTSPQNDIFFRFQ